MDGLVQLADSLQGLPKQAKSVACDIQQVSHGVAAQAQCLL